MSLTNGNIRLVNRKAWQMMNIAPTITAAWAFVIADSVENDRFSFYCVNATTHYLYDHDEDSWVQIPSGALAGTFGAGACWARGRFTANLTATGGSTTTATTTAWITDICIWLKIRFLSGNNIGQESTITDCSVVAGGTSTITFSPAVTNVVANNDTFTTNTGVYYVMSAGTTASGSFRKYDLLTGTWTSLTTTGLPATWGTDGRMIITPSWEQYATGTATAGGATTLTNSGKSWTANQWTNYQIRITAWTGIGQIRTITSNTGTAITVGSSWGSNPDATSQYSIEGNDDNIYLLGNNAVTMYKYSVSGNSWATMSPTAARGGAPVAGMSADFIGKTLSTAWNDETNIQAGRYIYSLRGGTAFLDRFDIAWGTAGAGAWAAITYPWAQEVFGSGSSSENHGNYIYIKKDATNRFFKYSIPWNYMYALNTLGYTDGAAVIGNKTWLKPYIESGSEKILWLYNLSNTGAILHRIMIY